MSDYKRRRKRFNREHCKRDSKDGIRVVYRCKTQEEANRRVNRTNKLIGTPFINLPGIVDHKAILFITKKGTPVQAEVVEMVFNDCLLMDAVSNWGEDGPLYKDMLDSEEMQEVYEYAMRAYANVEIPEQLKNPKTL